MPSLPTFIPVFGAPFLTRYKLPGELQWLPAVTWKSPLKSSNWQLIRDPFMKRKEFIAPKLIRVLDAVDAIIVPARNL